jgi:hypothetical protein
MTNDVDYMGAVAVPMGLLLINAEVLTNVRSASLATRRLSAGNPSGPCRM